jgi:hypothetical protein
MVGYALLPTLEKPTSTLTVRLTSEEREERDEWILGAHEREMPVEEIAYEVGLSIQRVKQIIKPSRSQRPKEKLKARAPRTPRDVALAEFWKERAHPYCRGTEGCCNDCFGMSMIIESEYDQNGWPYEWAMRGQEQYIAASGMKDPHGL